MYRLMLPFLIVTLLAACGEAQQSGADSSPQRDQATYIQPENSAAETVELDKFAELMEDRDAVTILDVRTDREFEAGRIPGAVQINFYDNNFRDQIDQLDKDKPVLVYCAVGGRSTNAMHLLKSVGVVSVYNLEGGFDNWKKQDMPIQK